MIKILFVCHGNICRSPMAEFILKHIVQTHGISHEFHIESAATSSEEIGNPIYPPARAELARHGICCTSRTANGIGAKTARRVKKTDYQEFDYLIVMENYNIRNLMPIIEEDPDQKVCRLLDFTDRPGDIDDPWYTRRFDTTYMQIEKGCKALLKSLGFSLDPTV